MKIIAYIILCILLLISSSTAGPDEEEIEEKTMILAFKDINVFEYDLDLVFEDNNGETVWFSYIDADLSACSLYTIEDHDGFPEYHVNEDKVGKKFKITYVETEVEGEFSGEMEQAIVMRGIEPVESIEETERGETE